MLRMGASIALLGVEVEYGAGKRFWQITKRAAARVCLGSRFGSFEDCEAQEADFAEFDPFSDSGHSRDMRRKPGLSPKCEFGFSAACARSVDNAAPAENSGLPRGGKTSRSSSAQHRTVAEFTDCGQNQPSVSTTQTQSRLCASCDLSET